MGISRDIKMKRSTLTHLKEKNPIWAILRILCFCKDNITWLYEGNFMENPEVRPR